MDEFYSISTFVDVLNNYSSHQITNYKLQTINFPIVISDPIQAKHSNTVIERKNGTHLIRNSETTVHMHVAYRMKNNTIRGVHACMQKR